MDRHDGAGGGAGGPSDELAEPAEPAELVEPVGSAGVPHGKDLARTSGRGAAVVLGLLAVAAAGAFALIGWDATRSSETGGPGEVGTVRTPAVTDEPAGAGKPSGPASAGPGAPANGSDGSAPGQGDSAADREARQRDHVRRSLTDPHPRPPIENPISQDELDRERDKVEATVTPVPAVNDPPPVGGIGTPQG